MSSEDLVVQMERAVDMLQVISEFLQDNFVNSGMNNLVAARAELAVSSLDVLTDFLAGICKEVQR